MSGVLKSFSVFRTPFIPNFSVRFLKLRRKKIPLAPDIKFKPQEDSLASRGFLRPHKPYNPPSDAADIVEKVCKDLGITYDYDHVIDDPAVRFSMLNACFNAFQHSIPNSVLNSIETVGDIHDFYHIPVDTTTPFEAFKTMDLPKNLHIQYEYLRFHPDKDTKFNGVSAYPNSSTLVTGLTYKKKYEGYQATKKWRYG
ncbi:mitochondrial ribosomal protein L50 [Arctopsyche grandis]|uniref:mitochondrial ribosomal protein L50 n=1 Tax=Arctopsyche grandis TaxID=121162 RepID=UPI00406D959F